MRNLIKILKIAMSLLKFLGQTAARTSAWTFRMAQLIQKVKFVLIILKTKRDVKCIIMLNSIHQYYAVHVVAAL